MLKDIFSPPVFPEDAEKTRTAKLLYQITLTSWSLPVLAVVISLINPITRSFVLPAGITFAVILVILIGLNRAGLIKAASILLITVMAILFTYLNYQNAGEPRSLMLLSVTTIVISGLLLGGRTPIIVAIYMAVQHTIIVFLNIRGIIAPQGSPGPIQNIIVTSVSYLFITFLFNLTVDRIQTSLNQARKSERDLQLSNRQLTDFTESLEQRVAERTQEAEKQRQDVDRRSRQLEGIIHVSRVINTAKKLQEILPKTVQSISEQFGFYHVGIFLNDSINQYAILSAASSEGGMKMIRRSHQLKIGEQGIVGYVTQTGSPRIALDVGEDAVFFTNPELPSTHSEMAFPLNAGSQIIGALDIQSTETGAFTDEDIKTLSALAEQVSLAIQNARLFDQTQKTLTEFESIQRQYVRETWSRLPKEEKLSGYRYSIVGAVPLGEDAEIIENKEKENKQEINVPIILRGETIGTLSVQVPKDELIGPDQVDLIKAVAERVALSAENARLFDETTRRAERERIISDIASKIGTSVRTESILRTTATELSQVLEDADIFINLQTTNKEKKKTE